MPIDGRPQQEMLPLDDSTPPTVTVEQAATILGISRALAFRAVRRGEIPALRFGRRIVIPRAALEQMLSAPRTRSDSEEVSRQ
jgi:excisionase family DNA binding protein